MRAKRIRGGKFSRRGGTFSRRGDGVDRISKLPEPIISLILSFLPTKTAVKTSVLSTRWRYLWTTAFNLDFSFIDDSGSGGSEDEEQRIIEFVKYVNWVLLHQKAGYINKFRLQWHSGYIDFSSLYAWLSTAIFRDVQELRVVISTRETDVEIEMPIRNIFRSEKLVSLELNCDIYIPSGMFISLPRIERLKLANIEFQNPKAFQQIITGCPILKYLDIDLYSPGDAFEYEVSSTSLIRFDFNIQNTFYVGDLTSAPYSLVLEVPSLEVLMLNGMVYWISVRGTLGSLVKAYLRHEPNYWDYSRHWDPNYCNLLVLAIRSFNSAQNLFLSNHLVWALTSATIGLCTKFDRLKELHMELPWHRYYVSVVDFIQCSDNLQTLSVTLEVENFESLPNLPSWRKPEDIPICLSKSLKTVHLHEYNGLEEGYEMVDYMLQNGGVLEEMEIDVLHAKRPVRVIRDISWLPRKSPTCKVALKVKDSLL